MWRASLLWCLTAVCLAHTKLPDLGSPYYHALSKDTLRSIGQQIYHDYQSQNCVNNDPLIVDYLQNLANRIYEANHDEIPFPIHIFLLKHKEINAFALPGGYIGVHTGLLLHAENEDEIAAVLAHEIGHIAQNHCVRQYEHQQSLQVANIAAMIASIALVQINPDLAQAALYTSVASSQEQMLSYSRQHEMEADHRGMAFMQKAGFQGHAMARFFEKMQERFLSERLFQSEYLRTHPYSLNRRASVLDRLFDTPEKPYRHSLSFEVARLRTMMLHHNNPLLWEKELAQDTSARFSTHALDYAHALTQFRYREDRKSLEMLEKMAEREPDNMALQCTLAECLFQLGDYQEASARLAPLTSFFESYPTVWRLYLKNILRGHDENALWQALHYLQDKEKLSGLDYGFQHQIYHRLHRPLEAHIALAYKQHALGEKHRAQRTFREVRAMSADADQLLKAKVMQLEEDLKRPYTA